MGLVWLMRSWVVGFGLGSLALSLLGYFDRLFQMLMEEKGRGSSLEERPA